MDIVSGVRKYIIDNNMLSGVTKVVIGVSGGADSVCLLEVLYRLKEEFNISIHAVHINHCIRGDEADADEEFVRRLCTDKNIEFTFARIPVRELAKKERITEEEAGRKVRYEEFDKAVRASSAPDKCRIAVAHNMNDNSETMLFNLFRGTGLAGIAGIPPVNGNIVRPLLATSREDIEKFLEDNNIQYRTDSTNLDNDYSRNKIRHNIMPYAILNINSKAAQHMLSAAELVRESEEFIKSYAQERFESLVHIKDNSEYSINVAEFNKENITIRKRILRIIIEKLAGKLKDIENIHIENILSLEDRQVSKRVNLPYNIVAKRDYDSIILMRNNEADMEKSKELRFKIEFGKEYYLEELGKNIVFNLKKYEKNQIIPKNNYTKWFDYGKIYHEILIRTRIKGDILQVNKNGMKKSLKEVFINDKVNREARDRIPLVTEGNNVMWIIGGRSSEAYHVDDTTENVLEIKIY